MEIKKATIHDIAARLNMSASTVSRALSNNRRISIKTRELVHQTATEMSYRPNQLASNLRKGKGKLIGVIVPRISRHFFSHAIAGMEAITNPAGYNLMICQTNEGFQNEQQSLQTLINNRVDGVIISIALETKTAAHFQEAINENVPLVFFDRVVSGIPVDQVVNDNLDGGYQATKHLIEQGYRKIFHLSGPQHINVYADRYNGYRKAMDEAGFEVIPDMVFDDCLTRLKGEALAESLIASGNLPDAIFSASDYSALGILLVMKKHGIRVPQEMGIAGFANEPFTELVEPGITTLEQFSEEIGKSVARILIERLEHKKEEGFTSSLSFKPKLIIRDSTLRNQIDNS